MLKYWVEEKLSTGEIVTIPFDTKEEMDEYIKEKQKENKRGNYEEI